MIATNILLFVAGLFTWTPPGSAPEPLNGLFFYYGALWPVNSNGFAPWQYVTSMFLHASVAHVFFNMLALWMFGVEIANMWGWRRFLTYYMLCGIGAGLFHSLVTYLIHSPAPTVGASGAVMGVIAAFGLLLPRRIVIIFPFPPMPARYAALLMLGIDLFLGVTGTNDGIAHFAHVGGVIVGVILLLIARQRAAKAMVPSVPGVGTVQPPPISPPRIVDLKVMDVRHREAEPVVPKRRTLPLLEFGDDQELIDALLDKASRDGYNSLTDDEKAMLVEASKRLK
ncbi:MAG TPA: rhomboid family intramembrane serine protease [Candidatus Kapabacteria bacterium]|nr:rhomboid family intramembrane serine protease [Candidatus Kapabacteria bacterium]